MTFIKWSLLNLCLEYNVDTPTLFPELRIYAVKELTRYHKMVKDNKIQ